ncbi:hypothetical protein PR202_ga29757 [Eleusine coracana subsp. coracana]|uniref:Uncharacterized protein n=1 Tax=Eleusine coracana subsp. coracana TaxID=191504 RepID=A0AAV5DMQ1_ELECO|nr:hypothetical protein PR202_ga29757 [Eleusine coracana subsp. coracana]
MQSAAPKRPEWWHKVERKAGSNKKKGVNSAIILGAWILWKTRNICVFYGISPDVQASLHSFKDEAHWRCLAGAKKLQELPIGQVGSDP